MTSRVSANALLRELSFCDEGEPPADPPSAFAFALDFEPECVWPDLAYDTSSPLARYPAEARDEVRAIIGAVARLMGARAPKALAFVNAHMETALVCKSAAIDGASSASNRAHVGGCVLTNIHAPADSVLTCAEALVHESIHQYLYRTELADGNFCDLREAPTFRSPWTGNRIPLHSLVHACFVWYGLLTLWCQLSRRADGLAQASLVRDKASRTMFGFAFVREMFASPAFPLTSVDPGIVAAIECIAGSMPTLDRADLEQSTLRDSLRRWESGDWVGHLASGLQRIAAFRYGS
jgi:hypothetical protein